MHFLNKRLFYSEFFKIISKVKFTCTCTCKFIFLWNLYIKMQNLLTFETLLKYKIKGPIPPSYFLQF